MSKRRRGQWPGDPLFNDPSVPDGLLPRSEKDGEDLSGAPRPDVGNRLILTWLLLAVALVILLLFTTAGYARQVAREVQVQVTPQAEIARAPIEARAGQPISVLISVRD